MLSGLVVLHLIDMGSLYVEIQNQFAISCTIALPQAPLYRLPEPETVQINSTKTMVTPFAKITCDGMVSLCLLPPIAFRNPPCPRTYTPLPR